MNAWVRRLACAATIGIFLPVATVGCFGKFQLVRKVYKFNQEVDQDKWIQWFVFLVLNVVPVYGLASWIDVLFANSVEFWTGENPISASAGSEKVVVGRDGETLRLVRRHDGAVAVSVEREGRTLSHFTVRPEADALAAWDAEGNLLARVRDVAGQPTLVAGTVGY